MAYYMLQTAYTPQAWAALLKNPQDRVQAMKTVLDKLGGKVESSYFTFGEFDLVAIAQMPAKADMAAFSMAAAAGCAVIVAQDDAAAHDGRGSRCDAEGGRLRLHTAEGLDAGPARPHGTCNDIRATGMHDRRARTEASWRGRNGVPHRRAVASQRVHAAPLGRVRGRRRDATWDCWPGCWPTAAVRGPAPCWQPQPSWAAWRRSAFRSSGSVARATSRRFMTSPRIWTTRRPSRQSSRFVRRRRTASTVPRRSPTSSGRDIPISRRSRCRCRRPEVFDLALAAAQEAGWRIVTADKGTGRIEATDTTRWFGFEDDIVVRLTPWGAGKRIDVRSVSRIGRSDVGTNARRIRRYLERLESDAGD